MRKASEEAQAYAKKRKAALERANALREARVLDEKSSRRDPSRTVFAMNNSRSEDEVQNRDTLVRSRSQTDQVYSRGITGAEVRIETHGNIAERIQIKSNKSAPPSVHVSATSKESSVERFLVDSSLVMRYGKPPKNPAGSLVDLSDRPLLCSSYDGCSEVVFGGSDHALYALNLRNSRCRPTKLYSQSFGHTDWVTSCTHLTSGRVLSCGMDKMCLWSSDKRRCHNLQYHTRSISAVVSGQNDTAYSASYDCTVAVWCLTGGERVAANAQPADIWRGHKSPVVELKASRELVASGGKDGALLCWDIETSACLIRTRAHEASITALLLRDLQPRCVTTGGSDGFVKVWDARMKTLLANNRAHSNRSNGDNVPVAALACVGEHTVVSGGADGTIIISDTRRNGPVDSFKHCDNGIYSIAVAPDNRSVLVGDGKGMLFCYDVHTRTLCYGIGASSNGAVRCIEPIDSISEIVTAGEDGKVLRFKYE